MNDLRGETRSHGDGGIWHSLNKFLLTLIVLCAAVPIAFSFLPEVKKRKESEAHLDDLKAQIDNRRMLLTRLQREENLLKHDREYIGLIARDRLDVMEDGETIYRLDQVKPDTSKFHLRH